MSNSGSNIANQSNVNKNAIDSQLFINCTFDMDYLEITKNESLRKYEENVYLLGNIFSHKVDQDESSELSSDSEEESEEDSIDKEIMELFTANQSGQVNDLILSSGIKKEKEKENTNNNALITNNNAEDKLNKIYEKLISSEGNTENPLLLQLVQAMEDYKEHEKILFNNKSNFTEATSKFHEISQKIRVMKPLVTNTEYKSHHFSDLIQEADDLGILTETFKQFDKAEKKAVLNCELPFDPTNNIVIMPL